MTPTQEGGLIFIGALIVVGVLFLGGLQLLFRHDAKERAKTRLREGKAHTEMLSREAQAHAKMLADDSAMRERRRSRG